MLNNNNSNRESQMYLYMKTKNITKELSVFPCKIKYNLIKKYTVDFFLLAEFFGCCYHNNNKKREIVEMFCHDLHVIIFVVVKKGAAQYEITISSELSLAFS